jgi:hypothetical protein
MLSDIIAMQEERIFFLKSGLSVLLEHLFPTKTHQKMLAKKYEKKG